MSWPTVQRLSGFLSRYLQTMMEMKQINFPFPGIAFLPVCCLIKFLTMQESVLYCMHKAYYFLEHSDMKFNPSKSHSETLCFDTLNHICKAGVCCMTAWRSRICYMRTEPGQYFCIQTERKEYRRRRCGSLRGIWNTLQRKM